jgi:opacity protein-like surface antigen
MSSVRTAILAMLYASASLSVVSMMANAADTDSAISLDSLYFRGDIGWSFLEWNGGRDDEALSAGAGVGYLWNDVLRSDVRLDWSGNYHTNISDFAATTLLGNTYINIDLQLTPITPYAGAGVGWGWVETDGGDDSGFTYSLMGGAVFGLSENLALDAGYRFREIELEGPDFTDHSISAGALFRF